MDMNKLLLHISPVITKIKAACTEARSDGIKFNGGSIECPKCSKRLYWSCAENNQHVHAQCETKGCLSWME